MNPVAIYKTVRDVLVIVAIGFILWRVFIDGKNSAKVADLKDLQHQIDRQEATVKQWHDQSVSANEQLSKDIHAIDTAPVVVHDWVRPQQSCPAAKVLSSAATASSGGSAPGGGDQSVGGTTADGSRRDAILAAWKRDWETRLAGYRLLYDSWPQP